MVTKTTTRKKSATTTIRKSTSGVKRKPKIMANVEIEVVKNDKEFLKNNIQNNKKIMKNYIIIGIILIILLSSFFVYKYFIKPNNYLIENKYYGFILKTPIGWKGEEKTLYTEDYVSKILTECKNDKLGKESIYEIGAFRFKSQKYPPDFNFSNLLTTGFPSGIILGITINCIPDALKDKTINYSGGETKNITFLKNNLKYIITDDIYISPTDRNKSDKLKEDYKEALSSIISSFKITR